MTQEHSGIEYQFAAFMQLHDTFLAAMAAILEADHRPRDFAAEFARFRDDEKAGGRNWFLQGRHGTFRVRLERDESHLSCLLKAAAPQVYAGKELMLQQPGTRQAYSLSLGVDDAFLSAISSVLGGSYQAGDFDRAFERFDEDEVQERAWSLEGRYGSFSVLLERGESYRTWVLLAQEPQLSAARQMMQERYLARGGDPARLRP